MGESIESFKNLIIELYNQFNLAFPVFTLPKKNNETKKGDDDDGDCILKKDLCKEVELIKPTPKNINNPNNRGNMYQKNNINQNQNTNYNNNNINNNNLINITKIYIIYIFFIIKNIINKAYNFIIF